MPVVMISGHGNIETAVQAIKIGAYDFIEKPFKADRLIHIVNRALESSRLKRELAELRMKVDAAPDLIGDSAFVKHMRGVVEKVAPTKSRIFIEGPAGSGKEIIARLMHLKSTRAEAPMVTLNCATMAPNRFEQELFGVESNNPQTPRKIGALESAHGGTLLLDEVADMPLETQSKIVRVLQDQTFERVGGTQRVQVDIRVIATSNKNVETEIAEGRFRQDLYYRLNVVPLRMLPLADRREDIPAFCKFFMQRFIEGAGLAPRVLGDDALATLQAYHWPGNIRQLRNVMEWLLIMQGGEGGVIKAEHLPPEIAGSAPAVLRWDKSGEIMTLPLREARELFEREYLLSQVTRFGGNISRTANFVGMERSALHRKLKMLGLHSGRGEGDEVADKGEDAA
jgi:two-component system nitrogen regulation response regulator NtrX